MNEDLHCDLPCLDTNRDFVVPKSDLPSREIKLIMISEAPPAEHNDYFYRSPNGSFFRATQRAFADAGLEISCYADLTLLGVYLTTAIKCSKRGYLVSAATLRGCSYLLEREIASFPKARVIMCMGDFAIRAVNYVAKRRFGSPVFPHGSTYRIRKGSYWREGVAYLPSYTQTGPSVDIEKSKRGMIAEDIARAMALVSMENEPRS